jgi:sugar O-acyltransferase (sialic acid O-acetyltransferase NeuD family)
MEKILLIGAGGHCKSVIDSILSNKKFLIDAILDSGDKLGTSICGYTINYTDDDLEQLYKSGIKNAFVCVGGIGDVSIRKKLYHKAKSIGYQFPVIYDSSAIISNFATIAEGVFIGKRCIINSDATVGKMSILNTGSIIEHDCRIGDYSFISVGAILSGGVVIGNETHIGTGANIIQGIHIGNNSIIGAGSVVTKNISNHKKAYGIPCKEVSEW